MKKDITCPTAGGTATITHPCQTGPPPTEKKHPHSKPTAEPMYTGSMHWDGTITVYPSGAPETTVTPGIECQGTSGPSCSFVIFASPTCSLQPHGTGVYHKGGKGEKSHTSIPTVSASSGATKTVRAKHTATCRAASDSEASPTT